MLNKESEILYCFVSMPWRRLTFTDLKEVSGKKSRSYLDRTIKGFLAESILKQDTVGRLPVYSLDLSSAKARAYAGFVLEHYGWDRESLPYADLQRIIDKMPYRGHVFMITGSYASGKQTERSDIDAVVLVEDCCEPKKVYAELSQACELNIPPVHLYVFRHSEFMGMLSNKEANYGKEAARNGLVLVGGQVYMELVKEAIENGLDGKYLS